jgi:hypothetical protein
MGTELNACPYYWPRKKGKIENPFKYIEEQFVKGNAFATMEELNRCGKKFIDDWCDEEHGTTKRIPNQHYLLEEKQTLQPLPAKRLRYKQLQKRIVSADSFVSIDGSKYSVPVKYVGKTVFFRIVYGFRIEIYDRNEELIITLEKSDKKHDVVVDKEHYSEIAVKFSTSMPQIRREFTARFRHGREYLEAAERRVQQPTRHARKILLLTELYDDEVLDRFIAYSILQDKMDYTSFKSLLKEYNSGKIGLPELDVSGLSDEANDLSYRDDDPALTRDCNYYEEYAMTEGSK